MIKEEGQYQVSTAATDIDLWLQYIGQEEVLAGSKHDLVTVTVLVQCHVLSRALVERASGPG